MALHNAILDGFVSAANIAIVKGQATIKHDNMLDQ